MHTKATVATIAALTLGVAACGSSGPLSSAELTKQASAICKQRTARMAVLRKQHSRDFRGLIVAGAPVYAKAADELAALKPPDSARTAYERFVAIQKDRAAQIKRAAAGGRFEDSSAAESTRTEDLARVTRQLDINGC